MNFQELLSQPYDAARAVEAYRQWRQTEKEEYLSLALELLLPLVTIIIWQYFRNRNDKEDLMAAATEWVFKDLKAKKFRDVDPASFTYYFKVNVRTLLVDYLRNQAANTVLDYTWNCRDYPFIPMVSQQETVYAEFRDKLPDLVKDRVLNDIRFDGSAYKACVYILEQLLEARPVVSRVLMKRYGLKNPSFYREYVGVLVRKALYEIRPEAQPDERLVNREDILRATRIELLT